jgi:hypothetical protein
VPSKFHTIGIKALLVLSAAAASPALAQATGYSIHRLGITDAEHTAANGKHYSEARVVRGTAISGITARYTSAGVQIGKSAWIWDGTQVQRVGYAGGIYRSANGYENSEAYLIDQNFAYGISYFASGQSGHNFLNFDAWVWEGGETRRVGLLDAEHTAPDGTRSQHYYSGALSDRTIFGTTARYDSSGTEDGSDSWVYRNNTTSLIGLRGDGYTGPTGRRSSYIRQTSANGMIAGTTSVIRSNNTYGGNDAWLWDGTLTQRIGLYGGIYDGYLGLRDQEVQGMTDNGIVFGVTYRNPGGSAPDFEDNKGFNAWVHIDGITHQVGLTGGEYQGPGQWERTHIREVNSSGQAIGTSGLRPADFRYFGGDAWIWQNGATARIGLTGSRYQRSDGVRYSNPTELAESGVVAGYSYSYAPNDSQIGQDAWVWKNETTTRVGLSEGNFTGPNGQRWSDIWGIHSDNLVLGVSKPYASNGTEAGQAVWAWNGQQTSQLGLSDAVHIGSDGYQNHFLQQWNDAGWYTGISTRITGVSTQSGWDAWLWDGNTTRYIGLSGGAYTTTEGFQAGYIQSINGSGAVTGYASRYDTSGAYFGRSPWYFDPILNETIDVLANVPGAMRPSDGLVDGQSYLLTPDGWLFGSYSYFFNGEGPGETHIFSYRPNAGFFDLNSILSSDLPGTEWKALQHLWSIQLGEYLIGQGLVNGQSEGLSAFLLTIPSPSSLFLFALPVFSTRRRRSA